MRMSEEAFTVSLGAISLVLLQDRGHHDYAQFVWPSALVLADIVWQRREQLRDKRIVEIGCGTGLPGLVAATRAISPRSVALTDAASKPQVFERLNRVVALNAKAIIPPDRVTCAPLTWSLSSQQSKDTANYDVVLSADCLYDVEDFEDVVSTIARLLGQQGECWMVYQERSSNRTIQHLLDTHGLEARFITGWKTCLPDSAPPLWASLPLSKLNSLYVLEIRHSQV